MASATQPSKLEANYGSPSGQQTWSYAQQKLSDPPATDERVSYISKLRQDVTSLQKNVNQFLTEKMEDEKRVSQVNGNSTARIDAAKEEENYGEEVDDS